MRGAAGGRAVRLRLAGACAVATVTLAACGGDEETTTTEATGGDEAAVAIVERTFAPHPEVESGVLDLGLVVDVTQDGGEAGGVLDVEMSGPFESPDGVTPSFDLATSGTLENSDPSAEGSSGVEGSLISTGDAGYITYDGFPALSGNYELDPTLFAVLAGALEGSQDAGAVMTGLSDEGETEIDGDAVTHVSGELDPDLLGAAVNAAVADAGDLGFGIDAGSQLPPSAVQGLAGTVDSASVDVYAGADDGLLRRLTIEADLSSVSVDSIELTLDAEVSDLNEPQRIEAPPDPEPLLALLKKYQRIAAALG